MENITLVAVDLAKNSFHIRGVNHRGRAIINKKVGRAEFVERLLQISERATIAMEACASAHYWGRRLSSYGHEVRLIAPQFVKPFVKSQKNDCNDAEGIAEAASRAGMRFVPLKSEEQQEILAIHRIRQRLVKNCTALMNEIRGLIGEFGYAVPQGVSALRKWLAEVTLREIPQRLKFALQDLYAELVGLEARVKHYDKVIEEIAAAHPVCQRLMSIPGIGKLSATALFAAVGDPRQFKNGRAMAAWLGLIPQQRSTGGKSKLGRITKRGDRYLRALLVHGARAVVQHAPGKHDSYNLWTTRLRKERGYNRAAVALANKNTRIAWALMMNPEAEFSASHHGAAQPVSTN